MLQLRSILLGLCLILAASLSAQEEAPALDSLWQTGSLWQVGENKQKVADARLAIIARGEPGLNYAISKLAVAGTLEIRCLRAVVGGFGKEAIPQLTASITHESTAARRNVADLLARVGAEESAEKLLAAVSVEKNAGVKLAQLSTLAKWKISGALPYIRELSNDPLDRIRHRTTALLKAFDNQEAALRLVEMLNDDIFYVRDGARSALRETLAGTAYCLKLASDELAKPIAEQRVQELRRWLAVACASSEAGAYGLLTTALKNESSLVRAEAAKSIFEHLKRNAKTPSTGDFADEIDAALESETDPFARSEMTKARDLLVGQRD